MRPVIRRMRQQVEVDYSPEPPPLKDMPQLVAEENEAIMSAHSLGTPNFLQVGTLYNFQQNWRQQPKTW